MMLTAADKERISAAIVEVERQSSGEVFCVLARRVSRYREVPLMWAALAAGIVPPILVLSGLQRLATNFILSSWTDQSQRATESMLVRAMTGYGLVQAGIFLIVAIIVALPAVRRLMTPEPLRRYRVRQAARRHFAAIGMHLSKNEPHILIFASWSDRRVELVAHENIHQAVGHDPWNAAVAAVVQGIKDRRPGDGFVKGIQICGEALAAHFPPDGPPKNRLPNAILEV
jgi:putative membrane protein